MLDQPAKDPRQPGATFALGDIGWIDFESRGVLPISVGTDRYTTRAKAIMLAWAIGDGPVRVEAVSDFGHAFGWGRMPAEFRDFFDRVEAGEAVLCAHNATFDRNIWNHTTSGFPPLHPDMIIDTRAQAAASGLPADLDKAAEYATEVRKAAGADYIKLFCVPGAPGTPQSHPAEWKAFIEYAKADIIAMRALFIGTRQLPIAEWDEYWAAEAVNDRGIGIDLDMVAAAARLAAEDRKLSAIELAELTDGVVGSADEVKNITAWLLQILPPAAREILSKVTEERDDDGNVTKPAKWQLTRNRVERLLAWLGAQETLTDAYRLAERVLQIRLYGGSKTPAKFGRVLSSHVGGVIRGQYVFNGASQTGRFSARGIQVHNLARDTLPYEMDALDALTGGGEHDDMVALDPDTPVSRMLSLLIRPSLVPQPGHVFVWGDWANIEARVLPWLAASREGNARLDVFRATDADPSIPDIYTRTAAVLSGVPVDMVDKKIRQRGKVVELACGFGGSSNALLSMAASYRMHLEEADARATVRRWRDENAWAVRFWGRHENNDSHGVWGALNQAIENPGTFYPAGRVGYIYMAGYLGGSLLCRLPSGRWLTYRRIKWEQVKQVDEDGKEIGWERELRFSREHGRLKIWPGLAVENIVQATAADILRGTLRRLENLCYETRLHTHDEVLVETEEADHQVTMLGLRTIMEEGWAWSEGLPIKADTVVARWYTKNEGSMGL